MAGQLPSSIDNSRSRYFPPIISQRGGSCAQAAGIGYMFTYEVCRMLGRDASASPNYRYSYLFSWNLLNGGADVGGFVDEGLNLARLYGIMSEADYGVSSIYDFRWRSGYDKYLRSMCQRVATIRKMDCKTDEQLEVIKRYLYNHGREGETGGVVTYSTQATNWVIDDNYQGASQTGYHSLLRRLATQGSHALTICGYDDTVEFTDDEGTTHLGAFIVVNSWGRQSHSDGRFYLPYIFFTHRQDESEQTLSSSVMAIDVKQHEPQVVFKVRMSHSSRDDLSFRLGSAAKLSDTLPSRSYTSPIFDHQGGDHPLTGAYGGGTTLEFALDYTGETAKGAPDACYFLTILSGPYGKKRGNGQMEALSVIDYRHDGEPREYVCRQALRPVNAGATQFRIPAKYWGHYSASDISWTDAEGNPTGRTLAVKTAHGRLAKMRIRKENGKTVIDYNI